MEIQKLSQKFREIEMPEEMKARIIKNCEKKMEEKAMYKNGNGKIIRRPLAVAAVLALCCCLVGVTALAATGTLQGFFRDVTRWDGAVVGTSYEQATDELHVSVTPADEALTVTVEMQMPDDAPYRYLETLGIAGYTIVDASGNVVLEGDETAPAEISEGMATITVPSVGLGGGSYRLLISSFVGGKKADQPLPLNGTWECEFELK